MKSPSRVVLRALLVILPLFFSADISSAAADPQELDWLEGFTLIELETSDVASLHRARGLIESYGGQVAILSPPSLLMGWVPFEVRDDITGHDLIKDVYYSEILPGEVEIEDMQTRHMVTWFNRVARGEYQEEFRRGQLAVPPMDPSDMVPDAWERGDLDEEAYLENLRNNGFNIQNLRDRGLLLERSTYDIAGNSDTMTGTVATTLLFVESDGSGVDPDTYTWTDQHVQNYIAGANTGMAWWSAQARNYGDCWVAFFIRYVPPTDSRCQQWREMVLHASGDVAAMVSDVMANFGYAGGNHWQRVNSYNTAQRATYGTDWAYTGFIAYNPSPAPDRLTDGASAFAYRGGPYTFLLYRSYGWAPEQVFAHESGHIFWACDEYENISSCTITSCATSCWNGVVNGNCEVCASEVPCMMLANSFALCPYTDGHVGWRFNPCAPAPLTPPSVSDAFPPSGIQGVSYDLTIAGSDFLYGAYADLGDGITITSSELVGSDTLLVSISIDNDALPGPRDVIVLNRDLQSGTITGGFEVLASTRHYVSLTGGSVFPYVTPGDAATTMADALAAAGEGDSLLVESTTFVTTSLIVTKGVTLSGAWTGGFTGRDVNGAKTTLDFSSGNILFTTGASEGMIEGFILENGTGTPDIVPTAGDFGGAVKIYNSTVKIAYCEIRQCQATGGGGFGGGGGVFGYGSTVTIENSSIHDNTATYGAGVYLYDCSAALSDNILADNTVAISTVSPVGAGIALEQCNVVTLTDNTIDGNTGGIEGGGLWIKNSAGVVVDGGVISYNAASFSGAGSHASKSEVDFTGVTFTRNTSSALGGGVALNDSSDAELSGCEFLWNTGLIGGGVYAASATVVVRHNLFLGNAGTNTGGALYVSAAVGGEVAGNTLDRCSGAAAGGMTLANSAIDVYNNIVSNSTGHGIACIGGAATLLYNDVWNSSGDDYNGCTPGGGSFSLDPAFVDTAAADYHLGVHSAAIDAGRPGASYDDPDGSRGDLGWFGSHAFVMDHPVYVKNLVAGIESGNISLRWDANPEGNIDSYAVYCDSTSGFKPSVQNFVQFVSAPETTVSFVAPGDTSYYKIGAVNVVGYAGGYSDEGLATPPTSAGEIVRYANHLYANVPNPFNPTTTIRYELAARVPVTLAVYDVRGRLIRRLVNATRGAGVYNAVWDGTNETGERVSSGVYFYKLTTPSFTQTRKMVILK